MSEHALGSFRGSFAPVVLQLLALAPAIAADSPSGTLDRAYEITPVIGIRGGQTLDTNGSGAPGRAEAGPSGSYGVVFDWAVRPDARVELFAERQVLRFEGDPSPTGSLHFDMDVDYFHAGAVYEPPRDRTRSFVAVALGLTHLGADGASVDESLGFSGSLGGGVKVPVGHALALRFELRGYANFTSGAVQVTCGPGCTVNLHADGWYQLAARMGLTIRMGAKRKGE